MITTRPGIYIHIPFCVRKCNYCAFLSYPMEEEGREEYVEALVRECKVNFTSEQICKDNFTFDTVYFGGGTPSILKPEQIERILEAVKSSFRISEDAEITLEANPGTLGSTDDEILSRLEAYRNMGINRLSMGVQSMNDDRLKFLGRIHSSWDVERDVRLARKAGFDNINLDIILSVPDGQDAIASSISDVEKIAALNPEHISCYSLQLEEGTAFFNMMEKNELTEVPDEIDRELYHCVCRRLSELGYNRYEISNFAKPGKESRHNSKYWNMSDYVGLGLGASGFVNGIRYKNTDDMNEYLSGEYVQEKHINTEHDNISEAVFLGLRRDIGVKYRDVMKSGNDEARDTFWQYYHDVLEEAQEYVKSGHLIIDDEGMRLTDKGIDISNSIMALFV